MKKAVADVDREIANEKLMMEKYNEIKDRYKKVLLTNQYFIGKVFDVTYGEFFAIRQAAREVYGEAGEITIGKHFSKDKQHFLAHESFISGDIYFFYMCRKPDKYLFESDYKGEIDYAKICQEHKNFDGLIMTIDMSELEKGEVDCWKRSVEFIFDWIESSGIFDTSTKDNTDDNSFKETTEETT